MNLTANQLKNIRLDYRREGYVKQHQPSQIKEYLTGVFEFTDVKYGNPKRKEGDIVIVNCKMLPCFEGFLTLEDYLSHGHAVDRIEVNGIYTNIYWRPDFFSEVLKLITGYKDYNNAIRSD